MFYKTVCDIYQLIPEENYTIPPEAEGIAMEEEHQARRGPVSPEFTIQQKPAGMSEKTPITSQTDENIAQTTISTGATTRRHKHTPSTGSFVTTIAEGDEEIEESQEAKPPIDTASMINANPVPGSNTEPKISVSSNDLPTRSKARESTESESAVEEPPIARDDLEKQASQGEESSSEESSEEAALHDTEESSEKAELHDTEELPEKVTPVLHDTEDSKDDDMPPKEG